MKTAFELMNREQMRRDSASDAFYLGVRMALAVMGGVLVGVLISVDPIAWLAAGAAQ